MENLELGKLVLKQIESEPESHDQTHWMAKDSCGTTACLAGWALVLAGYQEVAFNEREGKTFCTFRARNGKSLSDIAVEREAISVLGLTEDEYRRYEGAEARPLFHDYVNERAVARFRAIVEAEEARREQPL